MAQRQSYQCQLFEAYLRLGWVSSTKLKGQFSQLDCLPDDQVQARLRDHIHGAISAPVSGYYLEWLVNNGHILGLGKCAISKQGAGRMAGLQLTTQNIHTTRWPALNGKGAFKGAVWMPEAYWSVYVERIYMCCILSVHAVSASILRSEFKTCRRRQQISS